MANNQSVCNLCNSEEKEVRYIKNSYMVMRCRGCGLIYIHPMPTSERLRDYYNQGYFRGDKQKYGYINYVEGREYLEQNFRRSARTIAKSTSGRKILDVGCAAGFFLSALGSVWDKWGIEICSEMANYARDKFGVKVIEGEIIDLSADVGEFDVITMWDVLDHMRDPFTTIRLVREKLAPDGLLVLTIGDCEALFAKVLGKRWYLLIPPTHVYYFSKRTITLLLEGNGFTVEKIEREGKRFPLALCFYRLSYIYHIAIFNKLSSWLNTNFLGRMKLYLNFMDVMTVYARKTH